MNLKSETQIKLNRFSPREYQTPIFTALDKGYKKIMAILPRRAGKDVACWNLIIRQALKRTANYWYILPTYAQGRKVIFDSIMNDGRRFLDFIPAELIEKKNQQEMKVQLVNGSLIQIVGSDNYDALVGANIAGCVFSEFALQDYRAYQYIRPILVANDGFMVIISCVAPDTLIIGENGLHRIKNSSGFRSTYSDFNKKIWGLGGFHNAEQFYYGGKQITYKITLNCGYQLECTPVHPIWNGRSWIKTENLKLGDLIPIQYGQEIWGKGINLSGFSYPENTLLRDKMPGVYNRVENDPDFWYLLGLIHADGNYSNNSITVTNKKDPEIISFLRKEGFRTRKDGIHHDYSSRLMCSFLEYLGFKHGALNKTFPDHLLSANRWQMASFLQGVFDGDGSSHAKRGTVKFTSVCKKFSEDLQIILLNFGIASSLYREEKEPTELVKVASVIYNIEINGYFAEKFYKEIGFRLKRKQENRYKLPKSTYLESGNIYPIDVSKLDGYSLPKNKITNPAFMTRRIIRELNNKNYHPYLVELLKEKFYYSPIKSIEISENEVFDFVIPDTNSFFTNGFISHNTPRGKNHLWELWQIAQNNPKEWFSYRMTVEETNHIPLQLIEQERMSGEISEDMILQEYYCSFDQGVEGSYYAKYIDRMRVNGQIGIVPWEPGFKVHTAWDIGVRDSTSIIFFQIIGQTIRIIDCYEKSKEGLEHYINVITNKSYTYGKHIGPHDMKVQEFGSGITRLEKAKQLGIRFTVCDDYGIMDGIESVRSNLPKIWIDEKRCASLIKAIENYRQEFDSKRKIYKSNPLHDSNSHFADALRYLCVSLPKTRDSLTPEELDKRYREAIYGTDNNNMPPVFRSDLPPY